ncbi:MAG: GvpL/GvpF family gas vesicle protein [Longimicrobiales bacterium]
MGNENVESSREPTAPQAASKASEADEGKYVYCIIKADDERDFGPIGIGEGGNRVYTVHHDELAAVVSDTPIRIYDPTRENVLAHELVNETVMREYTVIPMSFGTIFRTRDDIVELLKSTYRAFDDVLEKMNDKIEFGLKVLWDRERVIERLEEEDEEIRRLKEEITRNAQSSTYFARMQLGRLIEQGLESTANSYVMDIHESLKPTAVASRSNKPIGDRMIMNAAYLVERQKEHEFDEAVKALSRKYEELLSFKYTGPWPPYNFVNIRLRLERAES